MVIKKNNRASLLNRLGSKDLTDTMILSRDLKEG